MSKEQRDRHEKVAQSFINEWEGHLLSLVALSVPEVQKRLFDSRNKLVRDLRDLLDEHSRLARLDERNRIANLIAKESLP